MKPEAEQSQRETESVSGSRNLFLHVKDDSRSDFTLLTGKHEARVVPLTRVRSCSIGSEDGITHRASDTLFRVSSAMTC